MDQLTSPPAAPPLNIPPVMTVEAAADAQRFLVLGEQANLWFEGQADVLIISFDNLATIDEGWPRGPWFLQRLTAMGYSVLGVQSHAKDWFRAPTAPDLLRKLEETGFFRRFRKVVMIGASMGGFSALNFAPLIPEARVLAFSPQSTMNKRIAPFEARFPFAVRKSNWEDIAFLDAAAAVPYIRKVTLLYDPFVVEDKAHAERLSGPNVQLLRVPHCTHEAIRVVLKSGAVQGLIRAIVEDDVVGPQFWVDFRARKSVAKWQRALLAELITRKHPKLAIRAADAIVRRADGIPDGDLAFARRAKRSALAAIKADGKG